MKLDKLYQKYFYSYFGSLDLLLRLEKFSHFHISLSILDLLPFH